MRIFILFLVDLLISGAVAAYLYFTQGIDAAFSSGLAIFISFSPICAVLAEPFALFFTAKRLSAQEIKINNPNALKFLSEVDVVALPYTRVLTCKEFYITDLVTEGLKQSELLAMAASAERNAEHILGRTIFDAAAARGLKLQQLTESEELQGRGVESIIKKIVVRVGSPGWIESLNVSVSIKLRNKIDQLLVKGKSTLLVSTGRLARGIIALKDEINADAQKFLLTLREKKIESLLLTAQPKKMAYRIAKDFEIDHIRTNLTPEGKSREIQVFRARGKTVAAIGTDLQDLPSILTADVSFLLAGGSLKEIQPEIDFAIPNLESFLMLREISLKTVKILKINRLIALLSWLILVPPAILSAFKAIPFNPIGATIGVVIFSVIILANTLRIK